LRAAAGRREPHSFLLKIRRETALLLPHRGFLFKSQETSPLFRGKSNTIPRARARIFLSRLLVVLPLSAPLTHGLMPLACLLRFSESVLPI
jgi:hypothetical protein